MNLYDLIVIAEGIFSGGSMIFYLWLTWPFIRTTVWPMRVEYSKQKRLSRTRKMVVDNADPIEEIRKQF